MSFDEEWRTVISELTLEELVETKETMEKAYAKLNQLILEKSATPAISAGPPRWKWNRN